MAREPVKASHRPLHAFAWSSLCGTLALLCIAVWLLSADWQIALRWRSEVWAQQPWTLLTASLTHLSDVHLLGNLVALVCLAIIGQHVGAGARDAFALLLAWPVAHLALLLWPEIRFYAGFSGLNHALAGILVARSAINLVAKRRVSVIMLMLIPMLLAKLIWESPWAQPLRADSALGFTVVQAAHLTGFVSGVLAVMLVSAGAQLARILVSKAVVE